MTPALSTFNPAHVIGTDPKVLRNCALRPRVGPDASDVIVGQFAPMPCATGSGHVFPATPRPPAFGNAIGLVGLIVAKEQMRRVTAGHRVAAVKIMHPFRDGAIDNHPCDPVSQERLMINAKPPIREMPAAVFKPVAEPQPAPAFGRFVHLCPEQSGGLFADQHRGQQYVI